MAAHAFARPLCGMWAGRGLFCATPTVTSNLGFRSLTRKTTPMKFALNIIKGYLGLILTRVRKGGKWMYKLYIMEIVQGWSCHLELFFKLKMNSSLFYFTTTKNNEPFPIYCSGLINTTICICRGGRRVCIGLGPRRFAPIHSPPGLVRCLLGPVRSVCSGYPLEHYW